MKRPIFILVSACGIWCWPNVLAQGTSQTVFPYGRESQNGSTLEDFLMAPTERQFWFRNTYLAQTWTSPVEISAVAFRVEEQAWTPAAYDAVIPRVEIWLSTTSLTSAGLSQDLNSNQGSDARLVFASDNVQLTSPGGPGPNAFGLRFDFNVPFEYNPQSGNLLIWIQTFGTRRFEPRPWQIDAHGFATFDESPVAVIGGPFTSPRPTGPVLQLTWATVPEPSCPLLLGSSLIFVFLRRNR
jgi:hypothetical protein